MNTKQSASSYSLLVPAMLVASIVNMPAPGALTENQVLLLYNGRVDESLSIRNAYVAQHPDVHQFDLDLEYPTPDESEDQTPPPEGITNRYITSAKFIELFADEQSSFQTYLAEHPDVVAIATTRGLPAVVSDNFAPPVNHDPPSAENIWGSFESLLSRSAVAVYEWQDPNDASSRQNPFKGSIIAFDDKLELCGEYGGICPGDLYLVSRLDSSICSTDYDGDGDKTHLDGVLALIDRCGDPIPVNTYATTILYDDNPSAGTSDYEAWCASPLNINPNIQIAWGSFLRGNWCQMEDHTSQFLHGPGHNHFDPTTDGPFMEYPTISLVTMGRNHCGSADNPDEPVTGNYLRGYEAHPAGFLSTYESYNGRSLHKFGASPGGHGQTLEWIGRAGGSFTTGHVQGITTPELSTTFLTMQNLYHGGFSWGEAIYSSINVGGYVTPIGDPLSSVTLIKPDINKDSVVDEIDRSIVMDQRGTAGPEGDLDGSGLVDELDLAEIELAFGRMRPEIDAPESMAGLSACGDITRNGVVDIEDVLQIISHWGECPFQGDCPSDTDGDYIVAVGDLLTVIGNWNRLAGDGDGNGIIDIDDLLLILTLIDLESGDEGWVDGADTNCDGMIRFDDVSYVIAAVETP